MFAALRSFFRRSKSPQRTAQRALFAQQKELQQDLQALMGTYERRLAYLQSRLLGMTAAQAQDDRRLFEEAHQSIKRLLTRLHVADQEAETLLREWHDWVGQETQQGLSSEAKDRLEVLRSELTVRGLLPSVRATKTASEPLPAKKKIRSYQPTTLGDDPFQAFDEVFAPRLQAERTWIDRTWQKSLNVGVRIPWRVWLTHRRKRIYGWQKRLRDVLSSPRAS
jgi:hypothetical protein